MGFLSGSISFERFRASGSDIGQFAAEHLKTLKRFAIDKVETSSQDEPAVGFLAGKHLLDLDFSPEKNLLGDVLHCGVRIDVQKIPAALRKAWLDIELTALAADNASGKLTKAQRQEAKEAVEARCEGEIADGRFRRMQQVPALWDAREGVLYLGTSSPTALEQCLGLFEQAFGLTLERITAGRLAQHWAGSAKKKIALENIVPSAFNVDQAEPQIAWIKGVSQNLDFLGNEFLLWLWWSLETQSDAFELEDGSEVVGMLNRTLSLECPLAESGKETITSESPVRLPEAMNALSSGKLPRKSGLLLVRQGVEYSLTLQAETLAVAGAKVKVADTGNTAGSGSEEDRVEAVRTLAETIDLVFAAFCSRRLGKGWSGELNEIQRWLHKGQSKKSAA
jgi:hypothetical protein